MSILIVQVLPQGMIFGADRNVTTLRIAGSPCQTITVIQGQAQRPKVLKWPNRKALIGYVGAGEIGGIPTDEWLYEFIGENSEFTTFPKLAEILRKKIEKQRAIDEGGKAPEPLIIHLGGFEKRKGCQVPIVWYIRNAYGPDETGYCDIRKQFQSSEEFWKYFPKVLPNKIKVELNSRAKRYDPFWFHQGFDLGTFNTLEVFLKGAFALLCQKHPKHEFPKTLTDWEQHLKMSILTYEAYFQAFKGPGEQFVGGGVDTVKIEWP